MQVRFWEKCEDGEAVRATFYAEGGSRLEVWYDWNGGGWYTPVDRERAWKDFQSIVKRREQVWRRAFREAADGS